MLFACHFWDPAINHMVNMAATCAAFYRRRGETKRRRYQQKTLLGELPAAPGRHFVTITGGRAEGGLAYETGG
jgi:hypothetical protein